MEGARNYGADPPPTWGLAIGLAEIIAAREVWLLVTGSGKATVLSRVVNDEITDQVPATLLRTHPNAVIWVDEAAAARL
jgi:6-phosphogluconolactonase/glucosamine-6-phosphate isomerase/deaminase